MPGLGNGALLAVAAFTLGLALGSAQPLTIILTYNYAPAGRSGEALGMRIMANKVTQIAVPLAFGGVGAAMGSAARVPRHRRVPAASAGDRFPGGGQRMKLVPGAADAR